MPKYIYSGNRRASDSTVAIEVSDGSVVKLGETIELSEIEHARISQSFILNLVGQSSTPTTEVKIKNPTSIVAPVPTAPKSGAQGNISVKPSDDVNRPSEGYQED